MLDKMLLRPTIFCSCHMNVFNLPRITFFRNSDDLKISRRATIGEIILSFSLSRKLNGIFVLVNDLVWDRIYLKWKHPKTDIGLKSSLLKLSCCWRVSRLTGLAPLNDVTENCLKIKLHDETEERTLLSCCREYFSSC